MAVSKFKESEEGHTSACTPGESDLHFPKVNIPENNCILNKNIAFHDNRFREKQHFAFGPLAWVPLLSGKFRLYGLISGDGLHISLKLNQNL